MLRFWLVLLLLANYLLVVGAGLVNRPEAPRYSAAHPYVHSADCQQKHYLMVDCFDQCNGDQLEIHKRTAGQNAQHLLLVSKGVDAHCLGETVQVPLGHYPTTSLLPAARHEAVIAGYRALLDAPPRRG
ncbi:hypothetical protein [Hymenobacter metallicola]|uniref:Uncharacterized protein n=1 Tax=Hymenobacter metallicola TaxID=2563114 RepID=A0A4Z0QCB9_9BACT|nr:hypothetical protein [Hymenobacter metallicola]TGE27116.1 hypothetical protein E5K02_11990 [Hymenobacter metallicola]